MEDAAIVQKEDVVAFVEQMASDLQKQLVPVWDFVLQAQKNNPAKAGKYSFLGLPDLETLDLSDCNLEGPIPSELEMLTKLKTLRLEINQLSGELPLTVIKMKTQGVKVTLSGNTGFTLPTNMHELGDIQNLHLSNCSLTGHIPEFLGNLVKLQSLFLANNNLEGSIPESFGNLMNLVQLNLNGNRLEGHIPKTLGLLLYLTELNLSNNQLTGELPLFIGSMRARSDWNTHPCRLSRFSTDIYGNSGFTLPSTFLDDEIERIQMLDYSNLELTGTIPESLKKLVNLKFLNLQNNKLEGAIPESLGNLRILTTLHLHNNKLEGVQVAKRSLRKQLPNCQIWVDE